MSDPLPRQSFGQRLRAERNRRGWSIQGAATRLHVTAAALGSYERGHREPSLTTALYLTEAYGLRLSFGDGEVDPLTRMERALDELRQGAGSEGSDVRG